MEGMQRKKEGEGVSRHVARDMKSKGAFLI